MNRQRYLPTDRLSPFVREFLIIESDTEIDNQVVPDTSIVMAFRFRGAVANNSGEQGSQLPSSVITGLQKSSRLLAYSNDTATLLVLFREGGAAAFFREPLHELFGLSLPLDALIHRQQLADVEDRLMESEKNPQRIALIEQLLLSRLMRHGPEPLIAQAVQRINAANGNTGIKTLAESLCISQDAFGKRFRRAVGTTPKQFASLVRFRHLISAYSPNLPLTDLAYEAGYFDQSHFIRDFRSFTGQTPQNFFTSSRYW